MPIHTRFLALGALLALAACNEQHVLAPPGAARAAAPAPAAATGSSAFARLDAPEGSDPFAPSPAFLAESAAAHAAPKKQPPAPTAPAPTAPAPTAPAPTAPTGGKGKGGGNKQKPPLAGIELTAGNGQSGFAGALLPEALVVTLKNRRGDPVPGLAVAFEVVEGGGTLSAAMATTDALGQAATRLTLGALPGANRVRVSVAGVPDTFFLATGTAVPASAIEALSGGNQTGLAGAPLAAPFVVRVRDAMNQPVAGFPLVFAVAEGNGQLSAAQVVTDAQGQAATVLTLGAVPGRNVVTATAQGLAGSPVSFLATGMPAPASTLELAAGDAQSGPVGAPLAQPFVVLVRDLNRQPVAGFNVVFAVSEGNGALSATTVATNAQGQAATVLTLGPAPGKNVVTASAQGLTGSPVSFTAMGLAQPASRIALAAGDQQSGVAGAPLAQPLVVSVSDAGGKPVAGFMVAFAVAEGAGTLSASSVATDAQGRAAVQLTLGRAAGPNRVTASAQGLAGSPVTFSATGTPGPAAALAVASGDQQTGQIGTALANPLVVVARDANGNPVQGVPVSFAVAAGGGALSAASATTDAQGQAATRLTLGPAAGQNRVGATSPGLTAVSFTANGLAAPPSAIALLSGDQQSGVAGAALAQPLVVVVRDAAGAPVQGFTVAFAVATGGGSLSASSVATNAQGQAGVTLTLGKAAGPNSVTATAQGLTGSPVTFRATGTAGPAANLAIASGNNQSGQVGQPLANPLVVLVTDANQNPVQGVPLTFAVATGGGSLSVVAASTNASGQASSVLTLGPAPGANTVTVSGAGLSGSPLTFTAMGLAAGASQLALASGDAQSGVAGGALAQPFVVVVRDAQQNPVAGFMVAFAVAQGGGTLSASSVATDAQGRAATTLTLGRTAGPNSVTATAQGLTGSPVTFNASGTAGPAAAIAISAGNAQSGLVGTALANPLVVVVRDANQNPVANHPVTFAVATGGGSLSATSVPTNAQGLASTRLTLGPAAGANTVTASSNGLAGSPLTFSAMGTAAPASAIGLASGNAQSGVAGGALAQPFVVVVRDAQQNPVAGFMVAFAVAQGGGTLSASSVATDAQGRAATTLTLGRTAGPNSVTATAQGLTGSPVTFSATGTAGPASAIALVSGNDQSGAAGSALPMPLVVAVRDANQNPVSGVPISFAVASGGGSLSASTVSTNAQGQASTVLTLGPAAGANTVTATRAGLSGSPVTFSATGQQVATRLVVTSGDGQSAKVGKPLAAPLVVTARDAANNPVPGVSVTFAVTAGGGALSVTMVATNAQGQAATQLTLGPNTGANTVRASATGLTAVSFSATGQALTYVEDLKPVMTAKCIVCHGPGGVLAAKPLTTYDQVRNQLSFGNQPFVVPGQPGQSVLVQKTQPGGTMADKLTPAEAQVILDWVRTGAVDGGAAQVPASLAILSGNAQQGTPGQPLASPLVVVVRDAANAPVANVAVAWSVVAGGGSLSAASTMTDLTGQAMVGWTLGPAAGANGARATVTGLTPAAFTATGVSSYSGAPLAGSTNPLDVAALSVLRAQSIEPAALCSDGEFIRRTTANLLGRLPTEAELSAFLADGAADKRARLVDMQLASQEFATFWARQVIAVWAEVPASVSEDVNGVNTTYAFDTALIADLQNDVSLDTIVTRFATSQGDEGQAFRVRHNGNGGNSMADQLMWAFTGMTSKCARCHDHPLTGPTDDPRWIQDDNYGLYAFFATSNGAATKLDKNGRRFGTPLQPRFVADGYQSVPPANVTLADPLATRRARFAALLVQSNAYARGTAHRIWSEIASPLLDPNQFLKVNLDGVASKPLLQALGQLFKDQQGSLKGFLRVAMGSRLYQLSSAGTSTTADPYQGRYVLRRHHGEALERGVASLAGVNYAANTIFGFNFGFPTRDSLESRRGDVSLEQALIQLNSPISTQGKVTSSASQVAALATQVDGNQLTFDQAVTRLVRSGLSRDPTAAELTAARTARSGAANTRQALEDVAVVVGASAEFMFR